MRKTPLIAMAVTALACGASSGSPTPLEPAAAAPTFSPDAGAYSAPLTVTITSATPGAIIHCTRDGSAPTAGAPACAQPIAVSTTTTLRAIATAAGHAESASSSAAYVIDAQVPPRAAAPTFSPGAGTYPSAQDVTLASATPGAVIHCSQDGSEPTEATPACAQPIVVSATTTIRAIATAAGHTPSAVASAAYVIDAQAPPRAAAPTFSPVAGVYASPQGGWASGRAARTLTRQQDSFLQTWKRSKPSRG